MKTTKNEFYRIAPKASTTIDDRAHTLPTSVLQYILSCAYIHTTYGKTIFSPFEQHVLIHIGELWAKNPQLKSKAIK